MTVYDGFGLLLASEIPLPLASVEAGDPDVVIERAPASAASRPGSAPPDVIRVEASAGIALIARDGTRVICEPWGEDEVNLQMFLLGPVMQAVLAMRGTLCLHASAVARVPDGASIAFVGPPGNGKSTLAAALVERGYSLVTDDLMPISVNGGPHVRTGWGAPLVRLWPDSRGRVSLPVERSVPVLECEDKHAVLCSPPPALQRRGSLPVTQVLFLRRGDERAGTIGPRMSAPDLLVGLRQNTFTSSWMPAEMERWRFHQLGEAASRLAAHVLTVPTDLDRLVATGDVVLRHLAAAT